MSSPQGHQRSALHAVALLEATKGALIIAAGFGLLALVHQDVQALAEEIVRHFHLNPASSIPRIFLDVAARADGGRLQLMAMGAFGYSSLRLAEAWGLWRGRTWAEWLGIVSGGIYLPIEIYELSVAITPVKIGIFFVNVVVVSVLVRERLNAHRTTGEP